MKKTSNSEYIVMQAFWDAGKALNRYEIAERVNNAPYNQTWEVGTVSTFVSRLNAKGLLDFERIDKINRYFPTVGRKEYIQTIINQKLQDVFRTDFEKLFLAYADVEINDENLKKLKDFMDEI